MEKFHRKYSQVKSRMSVFYVSTVVMRTLTLRISSEVSLKKNRKKLVLVGYEPGSKAYSSSLGAWHKERTMQCQNC